MEKARPRNREVWFVVRFDDGRTESMSVTEGMIVTGESLFSIAERRQADSGLSPGLIVAIDRDASRRR